VDDLGQRIFFTRSRYRVDDDTDLFFCQGLKYQTLSTSQRYTKILQGLFLCDFVTILCVGIKTKMLNLNR
jgi:hypothetical protein